MVCFAGLFFAPGGHAKLADLFVSQREPCAKQRASVALTAVTSCSIAAAKAMKKALPRNRLPLGAGCIVKG